jgi:type IV pilus assembly protein PilQ
MLKMLVGKARRVLPGCLLLPALGAQAWAAESSVESIEARRSGDEWVVRIVNDHDPSFSVFRLTEPFRVLIDISDARPGADLNAIERDGGVLRAVRTQRVQSALRVEVELTEPRDYDVVEKGRVLELHVAAAAPPPPVELGALSVRKLGSGWGLVTSARGTLEADAVHLETLEDPPRIMLDLHHAKVEPKYQRLKVGKSGVRRARVADKNGSVRIVLDLAPGAGVPGLDVEEAEGRLRLRLSPAEPAPEPELAQANPPAAEPAPAGNGRKPAAEAPTAAAPAEPAPRTPSRAGPSDVPKPARTAATSKNTSQASTAGTETSPSLRIRDIRFEPRDGFVRFTILADSPVEHVIRRGRENAPRLVIPGAKLPKRLERTLDVNDISEGAVAALSSYNTAAGVVLSAGITDDTEHRHWTKDDRLMWDFRSAQTQVTAYPREGTAAAYQANLASKVAELSTTKKRYKGRRISLDLKDADIQNVLRLLADVSKLNIVASDDVRGKVTIKLRNVPWDQALDIILRSKQLDKTRNGNIIRVAPLEVLQKEEQLRIERQRARVELEPLTVRLIPVSYAVAADIRPQVEALLSPRGKVNIDERTNVLIVEDIAEVLVKVERLVQTLDTQTPQVLIESRIVEARNNFSRELGVQWGGTVNFTREFGNQTGLDFPSDLRISGGADDIQNNVVEGVVANPNYAVNLPATVGAGGGGALGFVLGSVDSSVLLNLRLSAAEAVGKIKLVSAPKIVTLDNIEARILSGERIPITVITANGPTTRFIEANLELGVTPHVTQDGSILMRIEARKNELSDRVDFLGVPGVLTNEATTEMLVDDGDTAVLGGLYRRNTTENEAYVPWIGKVPVIGWLFKTTSRTDAREELLIFISPRIVNRQSALVTRQ